MPTIIPFIIVASDDYEKAVDNLLTVMCKDIVDDSYLRQNWATIYAKQYEAKELETIKGPFYGETINTSYKTLKVGNIDYLMITLWHFSPGIPGGVFRYFPLKC